MPKKSSGASACRPTTAQSPGFPDDGRGRGQEEAEQEGPARRG